MSERVHLEVYFKTTNPLPEQELKGIFRKYLQELARVRRCETHPDIYKVTIHELALLEVIDEILAVIKHCHKNHREITVTVTYGSIWKH